MAEIHLTIIRRLTYTFKARILPSTLITYATQTSLFDTSGPQTPHQEHEDNNT